MPLACALRITVSQFPPPYANGASGSDSQSQAIEELYDADIAGPR
jgi:hypothetical protein